jgi:hypothetical protein
MHGRYRDMSYSVCDSVEQARGRLLQQVPYAERVDERDVIWPADGTAPLLVICLIATGSWMRMPGSHTHPAGQALV